MSLLPFRRTRRSSAKAPVHAEPLSDAALVAGCGVGDPAALGQLFDRFHGKVFAFVVRLSRGRQDDVQDVVQTTFLKAFESASKFRGGSSVSTWLLGIALNVWRSQRRADRRYHPDGEAKVQLQSTLRDRSERQGVDSVAIERDLLNRLRPAIEGLPEPLLLAFTLCDMQGVSGVDAARILGIKEGTLYRRLHDARQRLRDVVQTWERS